MGQRLAIVRTAGWLLGWAICIIVAKAWHRTATCNFSVKDLLSRSGIAYER